MERAREEAARAAKEAAEASAAGTSFNATAEGMTNAPDLSSSPAGAES